MGRNGEACGRRGSTKDEDEMRMCYFPSLIYMKSHLPESCSSEVIFPREMYFTSIDVRSRCPLNLVAMW